MTKFGAYLEAHAVPEWASQHVSYKKLKKLLKAIAKKKEALAKAAETGSKNLLDLVKAQAAEDEKKTIELIDVAAVAKQEAVPEAGGRLSVDHTGMMLRRLDSIKHMTPKQFFSQSEMLGRLQHHSTQADLGGTLAEETMSFASFVPLDDPCYPEEKKFFDFLEEEYDKVNEFYLKQEKTLLEHANSLVRQLNDLTRKTDKAQANGIGLLTRWDLRSRKAVLQKACAELYRGIDLLKQYRVLNYTAFVKILKKHDKKGSFKGASPLMMPRVVQSPFFSSKLLSIIGTKVEEVYVSAFFKGNHSKGMEDLKTDAGKLSHWTTFGLGLELGVGLCMAIVFIIMIVEVTGFIDQPYFRATFPIYRGAALLLAHLWGWGIVVYCFRKTRVNYVFILEADPKSHMRHPEIFQFAGLLTMLLLSSLILFYFSWIQGTDVDDGSGNMVRVPWLQNPEYIHFSYFLMTFLVLFCPFNILYRASRVYFLKTAFNIFISPFSAVNFKDFFIADQLISLVRVFIDVFYSFCFYSTGSFLTNHSSSCTDATNTARWLLAPLPSFWRLMQCFKRYYSDHRRVHLYNAGKYTTSILVSLTSLWAGANKGDNAPLGVYFFFAICGTIYSYYWDIYMDWGLGNWRSANWLLRDVLVLRQKWKYYVVMVADLLLRISWVASISPGTFGLALRDDFLVLLIASLEVLRRNMWSFFRMENEHLNNVGQYRAVKLIPLLADDAGEEEGRLQDIATMAMAERMKGGGGGGAEGEQQAASAEGEERQHLVDRRVDGDGGKSLGDVEDGPDSDDDAEGGGAAAPHAAAAAAAAAAKSPRLAMNGGGAGGAGDRSLGDGDGLAAAADVGGSDESAAAAAAARVDNLGLGGAEGGLGRESKSPSDVSPISHAHGAGAYPSPLLPFHDVALPSPDQADRKVDPLLLPAAMTAQPGSSAAGVELATLSSSAAGGAPLLLPALSVKRSTSLQSSSSAAAAAAREPVTPGSARGGSSGGGGGRDFYQRSATVTSEPGSARGAMGVGIGLPARHGGGGSSSGGIRHSSDDHEDHDSNGSGSGSGEHRSRQGSDDDAAASSAAASPHSSHAAHLSISIAAQGLPSSSSGATAALSPTSVVEQHEREHTRTEFAKKAAPAPKHEILEIPKHLLMTHTRRNSRAGLPIGRSQTIASAGGGSSAGLSRPVSTNALSTMQSQPHHQLVHSQLFHAAGPRGGAGVVIGNGFNSSSGAGAGGGAAMDPALMRRSASFTDMSSQPGLQVSAETAARLERLRMTDLAIAERKSAAAAAAAAAASAAPAPAPAPAADAAGLAGSGHSGSQGRISSSISGSGHSGSQGRIAPPAAAPPPAADSTAGVVLEQLPTFHADPVSSVTEPAAATDASAV